MKIKCFIKISLMAVLTASCGNDDLVWNENAPGREFNDTKEWNPFSISVEDAKSTALSVVGGLDEGKTRSVERTVESVEVIRGRMTRSTDGAPLYYVINYKDNEGFAVVGADSRLRHVIAFSDKGSLSMSDTIENKGLAYFINESIRESEERMAASSISETDSLVADPSQREIIIGLNKVVPPLLTGDVLFWHQRAPFNEYMPVHTLLNEKCSVGCVALAAAMIMSYYEWPKVYYAPTDLTRSSFNPNAISNDNQYSVNWAKVKEEWGHKDLQVLLYNLGISKNLHLRYGRYNNINTDLATEGTNSRLYIAFKNLGYSDMKYHGTVNSEISVEGLQLLTNTAIAEQCLKDGRDCVPGGGPLAVSGGINSGYEGHAWVIDGFMNYRYKLSWDVSGRIYTSAPFYHCVWGKYGGNNGYYAINANGEFDGEADYREDSDIDFKPLPESYGKLYFWGGFIPNK